MSTIEDQTLPWMNALVGEIKSLVEQYQWPGQLPEINAMALELNIEQNVVLKMNKMSIINVIMGYKLDVLTVKWERLTDLRGESAIDKYCSVTDHWYWSGMRWDVWLKEQWDKHILTSTSQREL